MAIEDKHQQQQPNAIEGSPVQSLPTEITIEILLKNLPVKSMLRCKCVCKQWFSLISEPHFVKSHLNHSAQNNSRLIFRLDYGSLLNTCCLNDVMNDIVIKNTALEVVDYPFKSGWKWVRVVGSCNGLLCLHIRDFDILLLWNPSTGESHTLPPRDAYRTRVLPIHFGFGYDNSNDDYKVVSISVKTIYHSNEFKTVVMIYSLRNGSWKDIGAFPHGKRFDLFGKFVNGALHWVVANSFGHWKIISLDLPTESFGEVLQPVYDEGKKYLTLGNLGKWLCVLCDYYEVRVDLWAMKVYGVKDSWSKLVSVPHMPDLPVNNRLLVPLCISNDGRVLLTFGSKLMIYDSNNGSYSDVKSYDKWVEASTFVESLVSPMHAAAALGHR